MNRQLDQKITDNHLLYILLADDFSYKNLSTSKKLLYLVIDFRSQIKGKWLKFVVVCLFLNTTPSACSKTSVDLEIEKIFHKRVNHQSC